MDKIITIEPNKQQFALIMRRELLAKHPWAQDAERLAKVMQAVERTLNGSRDCTLDGSWIVAWKEIGLKGKPTYKGLHALPNNS